MLVPVVLLLAFMTRRGLLTLGTRYDAVRHTPSTTTKNFIIFITHRQITVM